MSELETLLPLAKKRARPGGAYAGEVLPSEAFAILSNHPGALLVDVRTPEEWDAVGIPQKAASGRDPLLLPWRLQDQPGTNPEFLNALKAAQPDVNAPVFFLCRGGSRSFDAANAATAIGYTQAFNVTYGYEGEADANGQRGTVNGWMAEALPWRRTA